MLASNTQLWCMNSADALPGLYDMHRRLKQFTNMSSSLLGSPF